MPALDALHLKVQLMDDLATGRYQEFLDGFVGSMEGENPNAVATPGTFEKGFEGAHVAQRWQHWLTMGYAFYVAPTMQTVVTAAAETMPQEHLLPSDLPTEQGFLLIPGGIGVIDVNGRLLKYNAVLWSAHGGQVTVVFLTDKQDPDDSGNRRLQEALARERNVQGWVNMPRLTPSHVVNLGFNEPLPRGLQPSQLVPAGVYVKAEVLKNAGGETTEYRLHVGKGGEEYAKNVELGAQTDPACRWLLTCWRMMQQTVTSVIDEQAPRALRRQASRANLKDLAVSVIDLRRRSAARDLEEHAKVEYSHRWPRRGHWRHQPYKEDGVWIKRLIWIHPTICGPEDKPLLIRDHVYNLVR